LMIADRPKKIEDLREARATLLNAAALSAS
jgi:hypothetical protein